MAKIYDNILLMEVWNGLTSRRFSTTTEESIVATPSAEADGLPYYPRVTVSGRSIEIWWDESTREDWGDAESELEAYRVGEEMELGLKSAAYVRRNISRYLDTVYDNLLFLSVPSEISRCSLFEGYQSVLYAMVRFERSGLDRVSDLVDKR